MGQCIAVVSGKGGTGKTSFTAGVGENGPDMRAKICQGLEYMGVKIDVEANDNARGETIISTPDSAVKVALIPTNEELVIARDTMHIVSEMEN